MQASSSDSQAGGEAKVALGSHPSSSRTPARAPARFLLLDGRGNVRAALPWRSRRGGASLLLLLLLPRPEMDFLGRHRARGALGQAPALTPTVSRRLNPLPICTGVQAASLHD